jgi:hypothetical protein
MRISNNGNSSLIFKFNKVEEQHQMLWYTPIIPEIFKKRREHHMSEASMGCKV